MDPSTQSASSEASSDKNSGKNLIPILIYFIIVIVFIGGGLFLYTQFNKPKLVQTVTPKNTAGPTPKTPAICPDQTVYRSIDDAVANADKACILDLSFNDLSTLPGSVTKLTNLNTIYLSQNKFTVFPEELYALKKLVRIDINGNKLTEFPTGLDKYEFLQILNLNDNNISKVSDNAKLPASLQTLQISGNSLDQAAQKKLSGLNKNYGFDFIGQIQPPTPTPNFSKNHK